MLIHTQKRIIFLKNMIFLNFKIWLLLKLVTKLLLCCKWVPFGKETQILSPKHIHHRRNIDFKICRQLLLFGEIEKTNSWPNNTFWWRNIYFLAENYYHLARRIWQRNSVVLVQKTTKLYNFARLFFVFLKNSSNRPPKIVGKYKKVNTMFNILLFRMKA